MALAKPARVFASLDSQLLPNGDEGGGKTAEVLLDLLLANGTGDNQADGQLFDSRTLVASANEDIDLQLILDGNNLALAAAEVVILIIQTPATNLGTIRMRDSAATPWISFLSSSGATDDAQLDFPPGVTMLLAAPVDGTYAVAGGNKIINFINLDGVNSNTYIITVLPRTS